jgi:hypothetical protein
MQHVTPPHPPHGHDFTEAEWAENDLILASEDFVEMTRRPKSDNAIQVLLAQHARIKELLARLSPC